MSRPPHWKTLILLILLKTTILIFFLTLPHPSTSFSAVLGTAVGSLGTITSIACAGAEVGSLAVAAGAGATATASAGFAAASAGTAAVTAAGGTALGVGVSTTGAALAATGMAAATIATGGLFLVGTLADEVRIEWNNTNQLHSLPDFSGFHAINNRSQLNPFESEMLYQIHNDCWSFEGQTI
jgi:hypothetical protein